MIFNPRFKILPLIRQRFRLTQALVDELGDSFSDRIELFPEPRSLLCDFFRFRCVVPDTLLVGFHGERCGGYILIERLNISFHFADTRAVARELCLTVALLVLKSLNFRGNGPIASFELLDFTLELPLPLREERFLLLFRILLNGETIEQLLHFDKLGFELVHKVEPLRHRLTHTLDTPHELLALLLLLVE